MSASAALAAAAVAALAESDGLNGAYDGPPLIASLPYALVETGPESDWSWKGGVGRELRLTAAIRAAGERPDRTRGLMDAAEEALAGLDGEIGGWRVMSCRFVRARLTKVGKEWAGLLEYRVRMTRE